MFEQMVTSPTRGQNILDLFFTTNPTLVDDISVISGLSEHDIVLAQVNVKPKVTKQVPRNIQPYEKANWDQPKQSMRDFHLDLRPSSLATTDVQSLWKKNCYQTSARYRQIYPSKEGRSSYISIRRLKRK